MTTTPDWSVAHLGPGDVLKLQVVGHPELSSGTDGVTLDESGALQLPVVGAIQLAGIGMAEANERVLDALATFMHDPNASLTMIDRRSKVFHIVGHIHDPGTRTILRPLNALEAVSEGGFFMNAADRRNIFLVRPHGDEIEVHRFSAETPDVNGLVQIRPGDIVFVRRTGSQRFQEEFLPLIAPLGIAIPLAAVAK